MIQLCSVCAESIEDGDTITMLMESTYKRVKSVNEFAISELDLIYIIDTLAHKRCQKSDDYYGF